jgi:predicted GH43/DUF377 family glycosyl hydrolase
MIVVKREGILLEKTHFAFENEGVMNPAVIVEGSDVHIFYRAVREGNHSTIGYCRLNGPLRVVQRNKCPLMYPEFDYESQGIEDPRIVKIEGVYYMTYTVYDGISAVGAVALSADLKQFNKWGIITSQLTFAQFEELVLTKGLPDDKYFRWFNKRESVSGSGQKIYLTDKDLVFFPRRIGGKLYLLHRIKPDIQLVCIEKLEDLTYDFWINYFLDFSDHIIFSARYNHESSYIGAGCPPIELPEGWLMIYHSVRDTPDGYIYSASAALLNLENPAIEIARLPYPLFSPEAPYELNGVVNKVCFPTGTAIFDDILYIYYGAADQCIACASVPLKELVKELMSYRIED